MSETKTCTETGEFRQKFSKALKHQMIERDMDTEQLAEQSGISIYSIRQYLRADSGPSLNSACKLATALACTPNDLCKWTAKEVA